MTMSAYTRIERFPKAMKDRTGDRVGRLVAQYPVRIAGRDRVFWLCRCDCGAETIVDATHLRAGDTESCGCLRDELMSAMAKTHGGTGTHTHIIWKSMRARCHNPRRPDYKNYGGRGITIDPRWNRFENFLADMGEAPPGMQIDRRDNDGPYCKDNCRWVTPTENNNNQRDNRLVQYRGETMTVAQFASATGVGYHLAYERLKRGWTPEEAAQASCISPNGARRYKRASPAW